MIRLITTMAVLLATSGTAEAEPRPLIDTHIHYSHDAWEMLPPPEAVAVLKDAGLKRAFVSSSSDEGTQKLYNEAPDLIVPVLRPYRYRGETGTWFRDESVVAMLEDRLSRHIYAGIGEFHIFGEDANLPVMRQVVGLAKKHRAFLHAHSDARAVEYLFEQNPDARILWAHSGFAGPDDVRAMLEKHPNLWSDLAFRSEHASNGKVDPEWRKLFEDFPERFMIGTDTYTPERWFYVIDHANWSRNWINDLPEPLASNIAYRNAETLLKWALDK